MRDRVCMKKRRRNVQEGDFGKIHFKARLEQHYTRTHKRICLLLNTNSQHWLMYNLNPHLYILNILKPN